MQGLDLDELLSEPSAGAVAQPQPGNTRQQDAGAAQHAAQSPAASGGRGGRDAQPEGGAAQPGSSGGRPGGGIGGNNDIVTRLKSRTERDRGGPA